MRVTISKVAWAPCLQDEHSTNAAIIVKRHPTALRFWQKREAWARHAEKENGNAVPAIIKCRWLAMAGHVLCGMGLVGHVVLCGGYHSLD
jgi:hypothetical protein